MDGYINIYRSMFEHWLWAEKPFSKGQAWIDLLQLAQIKDTKAMIKGSLVEIKRGQLLRSNKWLSDRWGWSDKKVRQFLDVLQGEKMVSVEGSVKGLLITIEKYTMYNTLGQESVSEQGRELGESWERVGRSNKKEIKKIRKKDKGETLSDWIADIVPEELRAVFSEWADMRKSIKKPITSRQTVQRAWNKLERLSKNPNVQKQIVEQSIDRCWASFYELKDKESVKRYKNFSPEPEKKGVPMSAEQREQLNERLRQIF